MAKRKVSVKNLRVFGQRIPDAIFRKIAAELLPGPDPTANELKNGAPSKAQVLASLCETDKVWRKKTTETAQREMSKEAKAEAAAAGWIAPSAADLPKLPNGEVAPCPQYPNGLHADGRDYIALVAELKAQTAPAPAVMQCGVCRDEATRVLNGSHYCDRHDGRAAAVAVLPEAFTFGNTPINPALLPGRTVFSPDPQPFPFGEAPVAPFADSRPIRPTPASVPTPNFPFGRY